MSGEGPDSIARLTAAEREALRLYLISSDTKDLARRIGIGPDAVEQRLARARRKLGVRRSLDAAHMLAAAEGNPVYRPVVYPSSDVAARPVVEANQPTTRSGAQSIWASLPTEGRPWNALSIRARLVWMLAGLLAIAVCSLVVLSVGEAVNRIVRSLT